LAVKISAFAGVWAAAAPTTATDRARTEAATRKRLIMKPDFLETVMLTGGGA
jgi:hypothetical protein